MQVNLSNSSSEAMAFDSRHRITSAVIILAVFVIEMSTDIYVPCLSEMTRFFKVDESVTLMTLSAYLFGFSLLGCLSGPLSDSYGRRLIMRSGVIIFLLGSIGCWWADSIHALIISRFFQGVGAGIIVVVTTTIVKDLFDDKNCSRILSFMGMLIALSPMIAPIFGGEIAEIWGWHANFTIIALSAIIIVLVSWIFLPESLALKHRISFTPKKVLHTYIDLILRPEVIGFAFISAIAYSGLWAWIAEAPFYFVDQLGIKSNHYGYYAAIGPLAYIFGNILNQRLIDRFGVNGMLRLGLWALMLGCLVLLVVVSTAASYSLIAIFVAFSLYGIGLAPVFANAMTKAVNVAPHQRGAASALLNTLEMAISGFTTLLVGQTSNDTLIPPVAIMTVGAVICCSLYFWLNKRKSKAKA